MNNTEKDNEMKDMLKHSMLEIADPEFNNIIMKKIISEDKKRFVIKSISLYFLIIVTICTAIILVIRLAFFGAAGQEGIWLTQHIHFIAPLFILILLKRISRPPAPAG